MKCHVCNYDIPAEKKFCPGCGRILSLAEQQKISSGTNKVSEDTLVYRPASTGKTKVTSSDPGINNIFNTSPDTPEYKTELAQNRATADVVEYDKMFMSRSEQQEDSYEDEYDYSDMSATQTFDALKDSGSDKGYAIKQEYDDTEDDEPEEKKLPFDVKKVIIIVALIAGLIVIVTAVYQIGERIGLWGETETQSQSVEEDRTLGEKAPIVKEPDSTTAPESDYKIGIYTVTSTEKIVFMQKSAIDARVIATVPNGTVLEITEISDEMGKATYGNYTGWLNLYELSYTPDAKLTEKETTTKKPEVTSAVNSDEDDTPETPETTTKKNAPDSPGTYTVDLQGDGTYLNVRDASSSDGTVVTVINDGTQVTVDKVENGWGHITTPDGNQGWIYMIYLK